MSDSEDQNQIEHQQQLIEQFVSITSSSKYLAEQYLSRNKNDIVSAIEDFYASGNNNNNTVSGSGSSSASTSASVATHPSSQSQGQSQSQHGLQSRGRSSGGIRTFRDLNDEEGDSEDDKTNTNFFTGGEKSALQVEDPNKDKRGGNDQQSLIDQIFKRAREQMDQPDDRPSAGQSEPEAPKFSGSGFKLGDGSTPSQEVVDPNSRLPKRPAKVTREITFWKQGFTVGDGPLHRYDDPNNASVLSELNRGRVPMSLLDVEFGQDVDVSVFKKTDEDWKPPKKKIGGFHGHGQRLGSPVPGELSNSPSVTNLPEQTISTPNTITEPKQPEGEGDSLVQIRFANGKRTSHKFQSTDSIKKVYEFVRNHEFNDDKSRSFALSHAFPVKPIEESDDTTVADAKLKNAVIVQRWT
ncbi:uncharacterized protein RJT21DRAFT_121090 [Scheffersomyces amazonensis]|uniref:uncharacterized protein n=1 Tax=Scheffersomyces amazonensis TaxID=1078765 RepID=UPI00315CBFD6